MVISSIKKRTSSGYSLIETMTVLAVLGIVIGLLYAYSEQGWKLFYQSYGRGLSQIKAKLAVRAITNELREANKNRLTVGQGNTYGVPFPDDTKDNSPFIYFTKPRFYEQTGDVIAYDYILYYFAKPKEQFYSTSRFNKKRNLNDATDFTILKSIKFLEQSKHYTEDSEKTWPFMPPVMEINKSRLPEDDNYIESIKANTPKNPEKENTSESTLTTTGNESTQFEDHFAKLKRASRNIPVSGNFIANTLTNPFTKEETNIFFNQNYSSDNPVKIKVSLQESPYLFGIMPAMTEFEVSITPRN